MRKNYVYPLICVYEFAAEKGFAQSLGGSINDFTKNEDDVLDE